jgi:hypothetical protein
MGTAFQGALAEERLADLISNGDAARLRTEALTVYEQLNADAAPRAPACDFVSLRGSVLAARCIVRLEGAVPSLLERDTDAVVIGLVLLAGLIASQRLEPAA